MPTPCVQRLTATPFARLAPVAVPPDFEAPPSGWHGHKLTELAELQKRSHPEPIPARLVGRRRVVDFADRIRALDGIWVERTQLRTNPEGIANSSARILPRGTVCYSRTASVGFVAIMAVPMATSRTSPIGCVATRSTPNS
ncbi:hypothetical protein RLIN73S_02148 [Rhodanobacter lindaniclasticus]